MHRYVLLGLLLLAGCRNNLVGPFEHSRKPERVDDPRLTIPEQQRRGRDRLAMPEETRTPIDSQPSVLPLPGGHQR